MAHMSWYMLQYNTACPEHAEPMPAFWYNMILKTCAWQEAMDHASMQTDHAQWRQQAAQLLQQKKKLSHKVLQKQCLRMTRLMSELSWGWKARDTPERVDAAVVSPCVCLAALLTARQKQKCQTDTHAKQTGVCINQTDDEFALPCKKYQTVAAKIPIKLATTMKVMAYKAIQDGRHASCS